MKKITLSLLALGLAVASFAGTPDCEKGKKGKKSCTQTCAQKCADKKDCHKKAA